MTAERTTPAPLDPSKVKAGDTVTLTRGKQVVTDIVVRLDSVTPPEGGFSIILEETSYQYLTHTGWTLTAHQPAPKPERTPAQFGHALVDGQPVHGFRTSFVGDAAAAAFVFPIADGGYMQVNGDAYSDFVPDEPRPLPTREQVGSLLAQFGMGYSVTFLDSLFALLRGESR
jgi:hypothetical protein